MSSKTCNTCKEPITDRKLKKYCRACLNSSKEERNKYRVERENTTICPCCKLYRDLEDYLPQRKLIYCKRCRELKNKPKSSKQGSNASTTIDSNSEEDGEARSSSQPMQEP